MQQIVAETKIQSTEVRNHEIPYEVTMKLTPLAKAFIAVVVFGVIGFATWHYKGDAIKEWAGGERAEGGDSKGDFDKLNGAPGDPARNVGSTGVSATSVGTGKLSRPLVVGINTWAGHAPGYRLQ